MQAPRLFRRGDIRVSAGQFRLATGGSAAGRVTAVAETGAEAAHAAILADALQSADSLLRRAAREIDPPRFERLFERLRSELPELVERMMREMRD